MIPKRLNGSCLAPEARREVSPRRQPWVSVGYVSSPRGATHWHRTGIHFPVEKTRGGRYRARKLCRASGALIPVHSTHGAAVGYPIVAPDGAQFIFDEASWHRQHRRPDNDPPKSLRRATFCPQRTQRFFPFFLDNPPVNLYIGAHDS